MLLYSNRWLWCILCLSVFLEFRATLAQLEITYKLNTNHQREQYEALLNKYNAYTALESQLDSYIQNAGVSHGSQDQGRAADGEKSHTDGSNVAPVYDTITNIMELHGNVSNPDSNSPGGTSNGVSKFAYQRRVEHSVKLAKDLLVLQNKYNDLEQKYNNTLHECAITKEMLSEAKIDYERISTCISHSNTNHPDNATITPVGFIVKQLRAVETKYKTLQLDYKQSKAVATTLQDTVHQQEQQIEEYKQQLEQCVAINNELLSMKGQLMHMEAERQRLEKSASQRINEQYRDTDTDSTSSSYDSYDSYSSETISDTHSEPHKERDRNRGRGRKSASNPPSSSSKPPTPSPVGSSFSVTKKSTPGPSPNSDGSNNSDGSAKPASVRSVQHTPNSSNLDSNSKKPPSTPVRSKENSPESNGSNGSSGHRKNMQMTPEQYNAMTRRPSSMDANSSGGGKHKWHVRESI